MGFLDGLFGAGDAPQRQTADYDEYSKQLFEKSRQDAMTPVESKFPEIDKNYAIGQETFGKIGGIGDAIKEKYGRSLSGELSKLKSAEKLTLRREQVDKLKKLQHAVAAKQAVQNDAMAAELEANNMKEAARAQTLGAILGLGGMVGGYAAAGGFSSGPQKGVNYRNSSLFSSYAKDNPMGGGGDAQISDFNTRGRNQSMNYLDSIQGIGEMEA